MEPQKGDDKGNAPLREALKKSSKIGGAKVVSKRRQYLAAVKPQDQLLVLELMHFADELILYPAVQGRRTRRRQAGALIDNSSGEGDPEKYRNEYRKALEQVIDEKIEHSGSAEEGAPTFAESHGPRGDPPERKPAGAGLP